MYLSMYVYSTYVYSCTRRSNIDMISYFLNLFPEFYDIEVRVRVRKYTYGVRKYESSFVLSKVLSYFRSYFENRILPYLGNTFVLSYLSTKVLLY